MRVNKFVFEVKHVEPLKSIRQLPVEPATPILDHGITTLKSEIFM